MRTSRKLTALVLVLSMLFSLTCEAFADTLTLPAALREIGEEAFFGDDSLDEVVVPEGTVSIGDRAFADSGLLLVCIPASVEEISPSAFDGLSEEFTICSPRNSCAHTYAVEHHYHWFNSEEEEQMDILTILSDLDSGEPDSEIPLETMTFDLLPTDGVSDPEELQLIEDYNAAQKELAALRDEMLRQWDVLAATLEEYEAFRQENVFDVTDEGIRVETDDFSYFFSASVADSVGPNSGIIDGREQEDGSVALEALTDDGGTVLLNADDAGISAAGAPSYAVRSAARATNGSVISRIRKLISAVNGFLSVIEGIFNSINTAVDTFVASFESFALVEQANYRRVSRLKINFGEKYLRQYRSSLKFHMRALRNLGRVRSLRKLWGGLNVGSAIGALKKSLEQLDFVLEISEHGHPTEEEKRSELKSKQAQKLMSAMTGFVICFASNIALTIMEITKAIDSFMTAAALCAGPIGLGTKMATTLTVAAVRAAVIKFAKEAAPGMLIEKAMEIYQDLTRKIDYDLHTTPRLYGRVCAEDSGEPLSGVLVRIEDLLLITETDENGMYEFPEVFSGCQRMEFSREGYATFRKALEIDGSMPETEYSPLLLPYGDLSGTVTDAGTNQPLGGVAVSVTAEGEELAFYTGVTDADGRYAFPSLPEGSYSVSFLRSGYTAPEPAVIHVYGSGRIYDSCLAPNGGQTGNPGGGPSFWQWCIDTYDSYNIPGPNGVMYRDYVLDQNEILSVTRMGADGVGFTSLEGINRFKNLEELYCFNNQLTSLDVSGLPNLIRLDCDHNRLTSLNYSGCTKLRKLFCCVNQLESLDLSGVPALDELDCSYNPLSELDFSRCKALTDLYCTNTPLKTLDLHGKSGLKLLRAENNCLESLNLSGCSSLPRMEIFGNPLLRSVNLSGCRALLEFQRSNGLLESLNLSGCSSLEHLSCNNNELESLNVSGCSSLKELYCANNRLTQLNLSGCPFLRDLICDNNELKKLDLSGNGALEMLCCFSNELASLNVSGCASLHELHCETNALKELDLSRCTALTELICGGNLLTSLDLHDLTRLVHVTCVDNNLTSLNCSGCGSLEKIDYADNPLRTVDFSDCLSLTTVPLRDCVRDLCLNGCIGLTELSFDDHRLETLDLTDCSSLESLSINNNELKTLVLKGCSSLRELSCLNNNLWSISAADCPQLTLDGIRTGPGVFIYKIRTRTAA